MGKSLIQKYIEAFEKGGELSISKVVDYIRMQRKLLENPDANLSDERRKAIDKAVQKAEELKSSMSGEGQSSNGAERQ